jgi:hypothetical protein
LVVGVFVRFRAPLAMAVLQGTSNDEENDCLSLYSKK